MSKARLLHREKDEGCSHSKAVVHIVRATSCEVALLMSSVQSANLRLLTPSTHRPHPTSTMRQPHHPRSCLPPRINALPHRAHRTAPLRHARQDSGCRPSIAIQQIEPAASACMRPAATAPRSPDLGLWDEHIEQERAGPQSLTWSLIECHCARSAGQGSDLSAVTALRGAEGSS